MRKAVPSHWDEEIERVKQHARHLAESQPTAVVGVAVDDERKRDYFVPRLRAIFAEPWAVGLTFKVVPMLGGEPTLQAREETERWGERERCAQTAQSYAVYGDARSQNATYDKGWADACFKIANVLRALPPALQAEAQRPAVGEEEIVRILDEELAVLFPGNPRTEVTAIMTDGVLRVLARATLARLAGPETT